MHAYAVLAALPWLHSLSHVLLLPNSVSTAVWGRGRLESQLAGNCLESNGNQVSRRSICLDVSWLPLVFPVDSSDSVLALFFALCKNHPLLMFRFGEKRAWCGFWWLYLGRRCVPVVHLAYRWRDTREKKKPINKINFGIWMKKKTKVIFCLIMMLASCRDQGGVCSEEMDGNTFSNLRALFQQPSPVLFCSLWKAGPHMAGRTSRNDRN